MTSAPKLPALPEGECSEWLQYGKRVNAFPHPALPVAERNDFSRKHWQERGYDAAPLFTASQMLAAMAQAAREQRERDAALCDDYLPKNVRSDWTEYARTKAATVEACAAAIRSQPDPVAQEGKI